MAIVRVYALEARLRATIAHEGTELANEPMETENIVILAVVLTTLGSVACAVNGYLGAGLATFAWLVLLGIVNQPVAVTQDVLRVTDNTWAPHLLVPLAIFLVIWQSKLRGRIAPHITIASIFGRD